MQDERDTALARVERRETRLVFPCALSHLITPCSAIKCADGAVIMETEPRGPCYVGHTEGTLIDGARPVRFKNIKGQWVHSTCACSNLRRRCRVSDLRSQPKDELPSQARLNAAAHYQLSLVPIPSHSSTHKMVRVLDLQHLRLVLPFRSSGLSLTDSISAFAPQGVIQNV